jgi:hypothetical protein
VRGSSAAGDRTVLRTVRQTDCERTLNGIVGGGSGCSSVPILDHHADIVVPRPSPLLQRAPLFLLRPVEPEEMRSDLMDPCSRP